MISKKLAIEVLNEGLKTGADFAEIFYENSSAYNTTIEQLKVETSTNSSYGGVGFRLLKGLQSVYGYTNDLSKKGLLSLASNLAQSFDGERVLTVTSLKVKKYKSRNPITHDDSFLPRETKIELIRDALNEIKDYDPRIKRSYGSWSENHKHTIIYNSNGDIIKSDSQFERVGISVIACDENGMESSFEGPGAQQDFSYFTSKNIDLKDKARKAAKLAIDLLSAKECPSGEIPVIIGNGFGGVLFHEACGHPLESTAVSKGLSTFADKLGKRVASKLVSAYDDPTIPGLWGSIDYDDEGIKPQKHVLIKNGILKSFLIDSFTGRRINMKGNGASRRQSYRYEPCARMSNTYIANGKSNPEDIIKATKLGLYTKGFTGGSVNPTTGEFTFTCDEAYIVRDGKICELVKGASLIGKGHEILHKIDMVGNDLEFAPGMCGASSGTIRTTVGQPTLRISSITVGGRGGKLE